MFNVHKFFLKERDDINESKNEWKESINTSFKNHENK